MFCSKFNSQRLPYDKKLSKLTVLLIQRDDVHLGVGPTHHYWLDSQVLVSARVPGLLPLDEDPCANPSSSLCCLHDPSGQHQGGHLAVEQSNTELLSWRCISHNYHCNLWFALVYSWGIYILDPKEIQELILGKLNFEESYPTTVINYEISRVSVLNRTKTTGPIEQNYL